MYIVNIKNNPFKTKKDIHDALNELQEHEE